MCCRAPPLRPPAAWAEWSSTVPSAELPEAALHNACVSHVLDFDETHFDAIVHVDVPVTAAGLAVAEHVGASGLEPLVASGRRRPSRSCCRHLRPAPEG